jgi:beta-N-acetylhexosaminidase
MKALILLLFLVFQTAHLHAAELSNEDIAGIVLMPAFEKNVSVKNFAKMLCDIHGRSYIILRKDTSKKLVDSVQLAYDKRCGDERFKVSGERIHLTVALDAEPSLMKYRMPKVKVGNTNTLDTDKKIVAAANTISAALTNAGISINFAPIYDTGSNKAIIGNRAFLGDQLEVTRKANLYMQTTREAGVIPAAKHFPGHGHTVGDTHKTLETISADLPELPNFISAIAQNVPILMVGHLVVKDTRTTEQRMLEKKEIFESDGLPATLSKRIMTDLLRERLGFKGVIITDSMAMGALRGQKDRTIRSLEAGADIVLIPPDPRASHAAIVNKMAQNNDFRVIIEDKVGRMLELYK